PLSASNGARTVRQAVAGALTKMRSSLETFFGRLETRQKTAVVRGKRAGVKGVRRGKGVLVKGILVKGLAAAPGSKRARTPRKAAIAAVSTDGHRRTASRSTSSGRTRLKSSGTAKALGGGRGPKKKGIYQARRKAWPVR